MEKKQTSVEWLEKAYWDNKGTLSQKHFEQAKQMEKEQIENAYWDGGQDVPMISKQCEHYYNETYGETKN